MSNTNNTREVISSFYFLDNDLQLQKIVTSKNVISAIHEQELNGLIRADIELDLSYSKFLVAGIDYVGYHYKDNFYLHKIQRVEHDHVDEITKVVLRHIFFEDMLYGKIIKDIRPVNREASYVLRNTIDTHSRWRTVMTDVTGSLSTNFYWQVMYEVIEFVTENYRIEYLPVLKFDGQKVTSFELHAANRIGEDKNIRIPFGNRVLELKYDVDYSEIVTRLVGHGKGEEVGDGYGRRIDFKDINFNKNGVVSPIGDVYMEDESITAMYGNDGQTPREGRIVFEDIEDPKELANETYNHYLKVSRPQMLFTADVADIGDVGIGDSVLIIHREHDVYFKARIHKLTVDLLNPNDAQIELGDYEHFKYSKVEKARAKSDKEFKKSTNNRIESLKRQFDTEFDSQVEEFRKEFEQKLIDVNAEIESSEERMENEMSQMKLTQQQRVDEIYEDIGGINQTVSDVANKADYLDGVFTDLSTQTGEVSSTVANIIDGKAPAGSVLKQTIDGVVGRVWEQDISKAGSANLLRYSRGDTLTDWVKWGTVSASMGLMKSALFGNDETYIRAVRNESSNYGVQTPKFYMQANQMYVISFDFKSLYNSGINLNYLHLRKGDKTITTVKALPSVDIHKNTLYGDIAGEGARVYFTFSHNEVIEDARILIGMSNDLPNTGFGIKRVKIEKGTIPTPWSESDLDTLKYTDLVMKSDGFMLGTFELGGDKIAQAILGKAGAIDLIADNVNLSNNLNVANQIKSLGLETVYANISEVRTRMLVANVITADMVKFDTALIEKFTSSTAFINSLTAKSAFIRDVQAIDLTANQVRVAYNNITPNVTITPTGITIKRPDGADYIVNGVPKMDLDIQRNVFMSPGVSFDGQNYIHDGTTNYLMYENFYTTHNARYLTVSFTTSLTASSAYASAYVNVRVRGFNTSSSDYIATKRMIAYKTAGSNTESLTIDLGVPTYKGIQFYLEFAMDVGEKNVGKVRTNRVYMHG